MFPHLCDSHSPVTTAMFNVSKGVYKKVRGEIKGLGSFWRAGVYLC